MIMLKERRNGAWIGEDTQWGRLGNCESITNRIKVIYSTRPSDMSVD